MMNGLDVYGRDHWKILFDPQFLRHSFVLEMRAQTFTSASMPKDAYVRRFARPAARFLLEVEEWCELYLEHAGRLRCTRDPARIAAAFHDFFSADSDAGKIRCLKTLFGLSPAVSRRGRRCRIKHALTLARFLDPMDWGILSWRVMAMLGCRSIVATRNSYLGSDPADICTQFEALNEQSVVNAIHGIRRLRTVGLERASDVTNALFALSLQIWPPGKIAAALS